MGRTAAAGGQTPDETLDLILPAPPTEESIDNAAGVEADHPGKGLKLVQYNLKANQSTPINI